METLEKCLFCPEKTAYGAHLTCLLKEAVDVLDGILQVFSSQEISRKQRKRAAQVSRIYMKEFNFKRAA